MLEPLLSPERLLLPLVASVERAMKLCQTCHIIISDEKKYCAYDGQLLVADPLATALQESVSAKYTVSRLIGTGSMGAVYRAQHHALGDVAIKVMLGPPDNQKLSERFLREAKALRKLNNPHSVLVYDLERSTTGLTYMVMEMIEGRSLRDELKERGHLPLEEAVEVAEAVCDALEEAHEQGIIHRDLKPDNILLAEERETDDDDASRLIKIVDFGIVKLRGTQQGGEEVSMQLTKYGTPIGTPYYMSPEQWFGDGPGFTALDGRTDIYALGCTLYEALSGYPPFSGNTKEELRRKHLNDQPRPLNEIAAHVPESVSQVILRALEKDRDFRPATAAEFAAEFSRACEESDASIADKKERGRSRAMPQSPESAESAPGQIPQLQTTEESVPVVRNWAAGEAQGVIEQVREQPLAISQARESQAQRQAEMEAARGQSPSELPMEVEDLEETIEPGTFRFEDEQLKPEQRISPGFESEHQQTLKLDDARSREACELMLAQAGAWHIGLFAEEVESIAEWRAPAPLPHAPPAVLGVVNVHGRMLTVIDPAALLGEGNAEKTTAAPAFIIALRGDEQLALAVNRVGGAIGIFSTEIELPARGTGLNIMRGVVQGAHGQTVVLDPRELFAAAMQGAERRRQRT
jgi:serine/threonine protein kinase/chemotaxis signal transduction protein